MFFVLPLPNQIKVSVVNRVIAKMIDLFAVFFVAAILPYPLGPLVGFAYSLAADGIPHPDFQGQSLGKKLMKLKVMQTVEKRPANFRDSAVRNAPVGVATFFAIIPIWGWLILAMIGIPLMVMEVYLMITVESGHRLGDVMGDTEVVDLKSEPAAKQ